MGVPEHKKPVSKSVTPRQTIPKITGRKELSTIPEESDHSNIADTESELSDVPLETSETDKQKFRERLAQKLEYDSFVRKEKRKIQQDSSDMEIDSSTSSL